MTNTFRSSAAVVAKPMSWVALLGFCVLLGPCALATAPTVRTSSGPLIGVTESNVLVFKGVPFAAPPLGERRWTPPAPVTRWRAPRNATKYAPMCPQVGPAVPGYPLEPTSEDCLYLNVWTSGTQGPLRPMVVFFHGGGFTNGSASTPVYWGHEYAQQGVVVVNVQYRVGALGFFAHPDLTRESPHHSSGNYGVLDAVAALRWVQRNARAFGGDPNAVTIMGHSAGSYMVGYLVASPLAKGLFHRVIGMTGQYMSPVAGGDFPTMAKAEADGVRLAEQLGARDLAALRQVPIDKLLALGTPGRHIPVADRNVLPRDVLTTFSLRRQQDVATLIGYTSNEGGYLLHPVLSASDYIAQVKKDTPALVDAWFKAYPASTDVEAERSQFAAWRDHNYGVHMRAWARMQNRTGKQPVYVYLFDHHWPWPANSAEANMGAAHGVELVYVFQKLSPKDQLHWTDADYRVQSTVNAYWIHFIKTGNPNGEGQPNWPRFTPDSERVMRLNENPTLIELPDPAGLDVQERSLGFDTTP